MTDTEATSLHSIRIELTARYGVSLHPSGPLLSVRSFLGAAIRKSCCPDDMRRRDCAACDRAADCFYARFFCGLLPLESFAPFMEILRFSAPRLRAEIWSITTERIPAYSLRLHQFDGAAGVLSSGGRLSFNVCAAISSQDDFHTYLRAIIDNAKTAGPGFEIEAREQNGESRDSDKRKHRAAEYDISVTSIQYLDTDSLDQNICTNNSAGLEVRFLSPARIRNLHRAENPFGSFISACLRRVFMILPHLSPRERDHIVGSAVEPAFSRSIPASEATLEWRDNPGRRARAAPYNLGGYAGMITVIGDTTAFIPLLTLARFLNVGAKVTHGLGAFDFKPLENEKPQT